MVIDNRETIRLAYQNVLERKKKIEDELRQYRESILALYALNIGLQERRKILQRLPHGTRVDEDRALTHLQELEKIQEDAEHRLQECIDHAKMIEEKAQINEISLQVETPTGADRALPPKQENDIRIDIATNNPSKHRSSRSEIVIGIMHSKADFRDAGKIKALCEALHNAGIPLPRRRGDKWTPNEPKSWLDYITMAPKSREHKRLFDPNGGLLSRDLNPRKSSD